MLFRSLDVSGSIGGVAGIWTHVQLAVRFPFPFLTCADLRDDADVGAQSITPLLIIVRIGLGITHGGNWVSTKPVTTGPIAFTRQPVHVSTVEMAETHQYELSGTTEVSKSSGSMNSSFGRDESMKAVAV